MGLQLNEAARYSWVCCDPCFWLWQCHKDSACGGTSPLVP